MVLSSEMISIHFLEQYHGTMGTNKMDLELPMRQSKITAIQHILKRTCSRNWSSKKHPMLQSLDRSSQKKKQQQVSADQVNHCFSFCCPLHFSGHSSYESEWSRRSVGDLRWISWHIRLSPQTAVPTLGRMLCLKENPLRNYCNNDSTTTYV